MDPQSRAELFYSPVPEGNKPADDTREEKFYPSEGPPPKPTLAEMESASSARARLNGEMDAEPDEVLEIAPSPEDNFFGEGTLKQDGPFGTALRPGLEAIGKLADVGPEVLEQSLADTAKVFHELGVEPTTAEKLHLVYVQNLTAPPSDETVKDWASQTYTLLEEKYGDKALERLNMARRYVASNKVLAQALDATGLGSHPEAVTELVDRVWRLQQAGRVKAVKRGKQG